MEQESENLKMGEHLAILSRAVKMLFSLSRGYILCTILKSFLGAAVLYVPIYFSARLLDAILYGAPAGVAFRYAGLTIGLAFLCNLLLTWINAARNVWEEKLYRERDWMFSEKGMGMEYSSTENRDVALLLARIRDESNSGYNLFFLYNSLATGIGHITSIVFSAALLVSFFMFGAVGMGSKL